ncbi:MAG TPA: hypothetical protein VL860_14925, partial [Planctomycetota bacterium]|nr:hypothetical protein [Planctomycetota bacterium]
MSEPTVAVQCSACQAAIEIPQSWQGKRRPCPKCHTWIQLPEGAASANPPASSAPLAPSEPPVPPPSAGAIDPYGNTMVSRPGLGQPAASDLQPAAPTVTSSSPGSPTAPGPLTFADRLKHVAGQSAGTPRPGGTGRMGAPTPGAMPGAGGAGRPAGTGASPRKPIDYGRPPAATGGRAKNPDGRLEGDPESLAWDDDKSPGWDRENSSQDDARRVRRGRRGEEAPAVPGSPVLGYMGFGAAGVALLLSLMICLGLVVAVGQGGGSNQAGWFF